MTLYRGSYQPYAPATGEVLAEALRSAQSMDRTAGLFLAQWWRPLQLRAATQEATEPSGVVSVWSGSLYLPAHWSAVRAHVVWAIDGDSRGEVTHSVVVDSSAGGPSTREVGEARDFDGETWLSGHYRDVYEDEARSADLGASAGTVADIEVRVEATRVSEAGAPEGRFGYVALGVTLWGVVDG